MGQSTCQVNEVQYLLVVLNNVEGGTVSSHSAASSVIHADSDTDKPQESGRDMWHAQRRRIVSQTRHPDVDVKRTLTSTDRYMKYNRLKKANPVPSGGAIPAESDNTAGRGAKGANSGRNAMSATPSKKRKVNSVAHEDGDDEEPQTPVKKKEQAAKLKVEDDEED